MNIFKETFILVKMVFSNVNNIKTLTTFPMEHYPFSRYKYMMWCGNVIYRKSKPQNAIMKWYDENHEMIHLYQAKDKGRWFKYYISYLLEWLKGLIMTCGWRGSYYTAKYEVEAYAKEEDLDYLKRRKPEAVNKFKLKNRKSVLRRFPNRWYYKQWLRNEFENT